MKKIIKIIFVISTVCFLTGCKEFVYELNDDKTGYVLKEYKGSSEYVIIPDSHKDLPVTEIGSHAFYGKGYIKGDLIIPENIIKIDDSAFAITGYTSLTITKNVEIIGDYAFASCENLTNITFHDNIKEIREGAFFGCRKLTGNLKIPKGLTKIDESAFAGTGYTGLTIPNTIKVIEEKAFAGSCLEGHIIIPDSVVEIGDEAFHGTGIKKINISKNVKKISADTFRDCNKLREAVIPEGVISIEDRAFFECFDLRSVIISSTITSIGKLSFGYCNNLIKIVCNASNPPIIEDVTSYVSPFYASPVKSIIVHKDSVTAYKKADVWKTFANIITSQ